MTIIKLHTAFAMNGLKDLGIAAFLGLTFFWLLSNFLTFFFILFFYYPPKKKKWQNFLGVYSHAPDLLHRFLLLKICSIHLNGDQTVFLGCHVCIPFAASQWSSV